MNGSPSEIMPANNAFRLVEVPAGTSTVEFRCAPASIRIGAALSGGKLLLVLVLLRR